MLSYRIGYNLQPETKRTNVMHQKGGAGLSSLSAALSRSFCITKNPTPIARRRMMIIIYRKERRSGAARLVATNERLISIICQHIAEKAANAHNIQCWCARDSRQLVALLGTPIAMQSADKSSSQPVYACVDLRLCVLVQAVVRHTGPELSHITAARCC
jgi:hypothetical protein